MQECRYAPIKDLPPRATEEQVARLTQACDGGTMKIIGTASRYLQFSWQISPTFFFEAIKTHLQSGYLIFQKYDQQMRLIHNKLQANVVLFEDEEEISGDVYVEFTFTETEVVLIIDAHNHPLDCRRLPRVL